MIAGLTGVLESIQEGVARVRPSGGGLTYHVLLPAFAAARLGGSIGQTTELYTLSFIESQGQGATMIPRLAGFLSEEDRTFFELFTTCKGIGNRKALRSMALDTGQLAAAIADRDVALLQSLPEIGRRTAETIVATLHGKVDRFVSRRAFAPAQAAAQGDVDGTSDTARGRQALEVLLQLGENRAQAVDWIDQVMRRTDETPGDVQALIGAVYRLKAGS